MIENKEFQKESIPWTRKRQQDLLWRLNCTIPIERISPLLLSTFTTLFLPARNLFIYFLKLPRCPLQLYLSKRSPTHLIFSMNRNWKSPSRLTVSHTVLRWELDKLDHFSNNYLHTEVTKIFSEKEVVWDNCSMKRLVAMFSRSKGMGRPIIERIGPHSNSLSICRVNGPDPYIGQHV